MNFYSLNRNRVKLSEEDVLWGIEINLLDYLFSEYFCGNGKKIFFQGNNINRITEKGCMHAECRKANYLLKNENFKSICGYSMQFNYSELFFIKFQFIFLNAVGRDGKREKLK